MSISSLQSPILDFIQMVDKKKRQDKLISLSKEKSYAYLATRDYDRIDPLCASFQGAHLGPGAGTGDGRDSGAGQTNGDVRLARDGLERLASVPKLPPRAQSGPVVGLSSQLDSVAPAGRSLCACWRNDSAGS